MPGDGGARHFAGVIANATNGTVNINENTTFGAPPTLSNAGTVNIAGGKTLSSASSSYTQTAGKTVLAANTSSLSVPSGTVQIQGGALRGTGTAGPDVVVSGTGRVDPGLTNPTTPGTMTVGDDYAHGSGNLEIDFFGDDSHDVLATADQVDLGGTLKLDANGNGSLGPFVPSGGESFVIMTFAGLNGDEFDTIDVVGLPAGWTFEVIYNPTNVTVQTTATRDVSLSASNKNVIFGKNFTLSGAISSSAATCKGPGVEVALSRTMKDDDSVQELTTTTTAANGSFSFTRKADENAEYRVAVDGTAQCTEAQSGDVSVDVRKKIKATASKNPVEKREEFKLTGEIVPCGAHAGDTMILYKVVEAGGRVEELDRKPTNGQCKATFTTRIPATRTFLLKSPAEAGHLDHITGFTKIKVTVQN